MSVRETLDYFASFRAHWNRKTEQELIDPFRLDPAQRAGSLSKGQRTQVALIAAVSPETDLLVLDEPTSGLDPIVRRDTATGQLCRSYRSKALKKTVKSAPTSSLSPQSMLGRAATSLFSHRS
jgi:ABC-type multidrug transport system ATPase subunit